MSTEQNKAVLGRWLEGFNKGNADLQVALADEIYTTDFIGHGFGPSLDDVKQFVRMVLTNAPGNGVTVDDLIAEGDKVVARFTVRGKDPSTGQPAHFLVISIGRFTSGKIAEVWQLMMSGESPW